jgi:TPR repeat protein
MRTQILLRGILMAALALSLTVSVGVAVADPFDDSIAAYDRGDYATAVQLLRPLAEQGDAQAQNGLGAMYYNGKGVAQDFKEAVKWYRLAAVQGNVSAQVNLGAMYYEGQGVAEDFIRAYIWLSIAASKGNADAIKMRDAVSKYMIDQQIVQAQALAHKCETSRYKQCE